MLTHRWLSVPALFSGTFPQPCPGSTWTDITLLSSSGGRCILCCVLRKQTQHSSGPGQERGHGGHSSVPRETLQAANKEPLLTPDDRMASRSPAGRGVQTSVGTGRPAQIHRPRCVGPAASEQGQARLSHGDGNLLAGWAGLMGKVTRELSRERAMFCLLMGCGFHEGIHLSKLL